MLTVIESTSFMAFRCSHLLSWKYRARDVEKQFSGAWIVLVNRTDVSGCSCEPAWGTRSRWQSLLCVIWYIHLWCPCLTRRTPERPGPRQNQYCLSVVLHARLQLSSLVLPRKHPNQILYWHAPLSTLLSHSNSKSSSRIVPCCTWNFLEQCVCVKLLLSPFHQRKLVDCFGKGINSLQSPSQRI